MNTVNVERLRHYTLTDAEAIGKLLPALTTDFSNKPVPEKLLREIIDSPYHDQIVARINKRIVGIATLSITIGPGAGRKAWLEDFVVSPDAQGQGIGSRLWREITDWCLQKNVCLQFTSRASREIAHRFYKKHGATVRDTVVFEFKPKQATGGGVENV